MTLAGKVALVTGGSRGIGRAVASALAAEGVRVAVMARPSHDLDAAAREVNGLAVPCDMGDDLAIDAAVDRIEHELGHVDILLNNAARSEPMGALVDADPADLRSAIDVNLAGPIRLCRLVVTSMVERGFGRVLNVSTGGEVFPVVPRLTAYLTTKAGLEAFSLNLAAELAGTGVTVNVVRPGMVDTPMQAHARSQTPERLGPSLQRMFVEAHASGRLLEPDRVAQAIVRLLKSDRTGEVVNLPAEM